MSSRISGRVLRVAGALLMIAGSLVGLGSVVSLLAPPPAITDVTDVERAQEVQALRESGAALGAMISVIAGGGLLVFGFVVFRYGRRKLLKAIARLPDSSIPGAVLYLRAFDGDRVSGLGHMSITTEEEQLLKALRGMGSAVAIGRPGENLPQIGAPRVYYDDDEWRDRVEKLIRSARLLVIRTGIGEGLRWEIEHAIRWVRPEQLVVVVADEMSLQAFRKWTSPTVGWPDMPVRFRKCFFTSIRGFVIFDQRWSPHHIRLNRLSLLRRGVFQFREFRSALTPVLTR